MKNTDTQGLNKNYWWIPFLSGLVLLFFGIWFLVAPLESFKTLTVVFGLIILITGFMEIYIALKNRGFAVDYLSYIWGGVLNVILGVLLVVNPNTILVIISILIGFWLIYKGGEIIKKALSLKKANNEKWKNTLAFGIFFILLAIILLWHPQIIGFTIAIWTSLAFILLGILRMYLSLKIRSLNK